MTEREQHTDSKTTARKIVATFDEFRNSYDRYVDQMDDLVSSLDGDEALHRKAQFLVTGLDHVAIFMQSAEDVVRWRIKPVADK